MSIVSLLRFHSIAQDEIEKATSAPIIFESSKPEILDAGFNQDIFGCF
jgi:hypothetical protein